LKSKTVQEFKETEIGKIPIDWDVRTIKECSSEEPYSTQIGPFGKALMSSEYTISGVPVLRGINVNLARFHDNDFVFVSKEKYNELKKFEAFPDDILLVHKGSIGKIGLMPLKRKFSHYLLGNSMMRVKCEKTILLPKFLYYWLSSVFGQNYLYSRISQVGVPQLQTPLRTLREAKLSLPSITEQQQIVDTLFSVEESINNLKNQNKILEQIAQAIFKSWFVDFDGVTEFEDSELGKIPKGWGVEKLADLCTTQYGYTESASDQKIGPKFLRVTDMNKQPWINWNKVPYCKITETNFKKYSLKQGDLVVSRMADPGKVGIIEEDTDAVFASYLVRLKVISIEQSYFIFYFIRSRKYLDYAEGISSGGSVQKNMNAKRITDIDLVKPSDEKIKLFFNLIYPFRIKITKINHQIQSLTKTRDALLPKLMSGEIRV